MEKERLEKEKNDKNVIMAGDGNENKEKDKNKEELVQKIFEELEEQLYISSFKPEEEIKEQIIALDCDRDRINAWIETIM